MRVSRLAVWSIALATVAICDGPRPAFSSAYPGFIDLVSNPNLIFSVPSVAKPAYLSPGIEPTFGATIQRIADNSGQPLVVPGTNGVWGTDSRHHYSKDQPWNADGILLAIQNPGSGGGTPTRILLDGETYAPRYGRCEFTLGDFRWHPSRDHAYEQIGVREAQDSLVWFNPVTCIQTRGWKLPFTPDLIGQGEGNPSLDGRFIAIANSEFIVVVDMDPQPPFASYDSGNRRIGPVYVIRPCSLSVSSPNTCNIGNIGISASGKYVDLKFSGTAADSTSNAHRILEVDPVTLALRPHNMADDAMRCGVFQGRPNGWIMPLKHADMALNPFDNNEDVIIGGRTCPGSTTGRVVMVRMRDGLVSALTDPSNEASVRHVSTRNLDRPGWVYVSYYQGANKRFNDEIVAIKMDGSQEVQRFAHQHSVSSGCYRCEPHAVPSRDGRRVIWASNWAEACTDCGANNEIKDYVVDARASGPDQAPVVTVPGSFIATQGVPLSISVTAADPDGDAITALEADLSHLPLGHNATFTPNASFTGGTLQWTPAAADVRPASYDVAFSASNALTGVAATSITVREVNRPPSVTVPAEVVGTENVPLSVSVSAVDPDGDPITTLTADLSSVPGATFTVSDDHTSGVLNWTPGYADAGFHTVSFTASNDLAGSASTQLSIANVDGPPVVTAAPTVAGAEGSVMSVAVSVSDPDGDAITALTADISSLPAGASFVADAGNASGLLTWSTGFGDAGAYTVTFTASNTLTGSAETRITIANVDRAPALTAPGSASVQEGALLSLTVTAADPDGEAIASLTADLSGLPTGHNAVFTVNDAKTAGTLTWTPSYADGRATPYAVRITAANAISATVTTNVSVVNVDAPPVVNAPASVAATEGTQVKINVTASDPDGNAITSLTADFSGLPPGHNAVFSAKSSKTSGTFTWTPAAGTANTTPWTVRFIAKNVLTGTTTSSITVSRVNRAPVVTAPSSVRISPGAALVVNVTASDPDGDPIVSLTANLSGLPGGNTAVFTADPAKTTGRLTWTPRSTDIGSFSVTFTATNSLSGSATTTIRVSRSGAAAAGTAIDDSPASGALPAAIALSGARPNPSPGSVMFALDLPRAAAVRWRVVDVQGRTIRSESGMFDAGRAALLWDGAGEDGVGAPAGLYFLRAEIEDTRWTKRFALVR